MTTQARNVFLWAALCCSAAAIGLVLWHGMKHRLGPCPPDANLDLVNVGMTRAEVVAAVGGPPGRYDLRAFCPSDGNGLVRGYEAWICHERCLFVKFDDAGLAVDVAIEAALIAKPSEDAWWWRLW